MKSKKHVTKTTQGLLCHIPPFLQIQGLPPSLVSQPQLLTLKSLLLHSSLKPMCITGNPGPPMSFARKKAEERKMKKPWDWHLKHLLLPIFLMDPKLSSQKLSWVSLNKKDTANPSSPWPSYGQSREIFAKETWKKLKRETELS